MNVAAKLKWNGMHVLALLGYSQAARSKSKMIIILMQCIILLRCHFCSRNGRIDHVLNLWLTIANLWCVERAQRVNHKCTVG